MRGLIPTTIGTLELTLAVGGCQPVDVASSSGGAQTSTGDSQSETGATSPTSSTSGATDSSDVPPDDSYDYYGTCAIETACFGSECHNDYDCGCGYQCDNGYCEFGGDECCSDSDCPYAYVCEDAACVPTLLPACRALAFVAQDVALAGEPSSLALADLDGDGDLDLAVAEPGTGRIDLVFNDGGGNLAVGGLGPTSLSGRRIG